MRKYQYETTEDVAWDIFDRSAFSTLACIREDKTPYAFVVSMARVDQTLYFHCAKEGEKNMALQANPQVCISSVAKHDTIQKRYSVLYESVIIEGNAKAVEDEVEKSKALYAICERYTPDYLENVNKVIQASLAVTEIYKIEVNSITGKKK